jgi:uncharacterized protein YdeI (YjbR/CyaY-like superfamily)
MNNSAVDQKPAIQPASRAEWRAWLAENHATSAGVWLITWKKQAARPTVAYEEAVEEALCFGWIDGVRRSLGDGRWTIRFTPRKARSIWSLVNIRHAERLEQQGRMAAPGRKAFEARDAKRSGVYSFEQRKQIELDREATKAFKVKPKAWAFFQAQPPGYRRTATFWVMSAKKPETKHRRLTQLIDDSAKGRRLGMLSRPEKKAP